MQLKYEGNVMPFEDSMRKVSALAWSPNGRKLAVGAADRVDHFLFRQCISLTRMEIRKINFLQRLRIKDRNLM